MYAMYPVAYPTALLLDYFLGESHGTVYKKAGKCIFETLIYSLNPHMFRRPQNTRITAPS